MAAIEAALDRAGGRADQVAEFSHGMTVATNALLEGRGARTALIATEGFTDIVALGRQNRAELYRLCAARPAPLAPDELRFGAPERMTPDGPLTVLTSRRCAAARAAGRRGRARGGRGRAAALLPAPRARARDRATRSPRSWPGRPRVALARGRGHLPRVRARRHDRGRRRALAAARRAICARLVERARAARLPEPAIMQSNGGLIDARGGRRPRLVDGALRSGRRRGRRRLRRPHGRRAGRAVLRHGRHLVRRVRGRRTATVQERELRRGRRDDRWRCRCSRSTRSGAGGGSIAWRDRGGALRVGPRSAGADPGPGVLRARRHRADGHRREPACSATCAADAPLAAA